jgi:hypothetical protein
MQEHSDVAWLKTERLCNLRTCFAMEVLGAQDIGTALVQSIKSLVNDQFVKKFLFEILGCRACRDLVECDQAGLFAK